MKPVRIAITLLFVLATSAAFAASPAQKSFEELKALNGTWEGKTPKGEAVEVSYRVTSNGSALMSEIKGKEDMITMFNLDGERLLMTHYCAMRATNLAWWLALRPTARRFTFAFLDATNLATPDAPHMNHLVISMPDANHHTEEWVYNDHGKEMKESLICGASRNRLSRGRDGRRRPSFLEIKIETHYDEAPQGLRGWLARRVGEAEKISRS